MIAECIILGVVLSGIIHFNGRKKTVFIGKIIEKHFYSRDNSFHFVVAIDKKTVWPVRCTSDEFNFYIIGDKFEFKIKDVL